MKAVATAPHEYTASFIYDDGLGPWFAAAKRTSDGGGSVSGSFERDGEMWEVTLSYQESGLVPPDSGETPEGTTIEFDTIREYRLNATVVDEIGEKKVKSHIRPRWKGLQSESGKDAARPLWALGDAVDVRVNASNVEPEIVETIIQRAADAVAINPDHFSDMDHQHSVVLDAARYVRIDEDESGSIHAREGPIARLGHLLENDRSGFRQLKQDDTEREGYMHTVQLGPERIRECFPDHQIPKEIKHYYARESESFDDDDPLSHPKLEAAYQTTLADDPIRPEDHDRLKTELEEAVLAILNEAGLPTQPIDSGSGGSGGTFVEDAYFDADTVDRSRILTLSLERIEADQQNVVVRHLADGLSPVEWGSLETLVSDGGQVSPAEIADEHDYHPDSVRRALRRIGDMVDRERGSVALKSHFVAEQVVDALQTARESVQNAVGAAAHAVENAERKSLDARTDELIAYCQANGIHIDEREAQLRIRLGDLSDREWRDVITELKRYWTDAGRDLGRFRKAVSEFRDTSGPKVRPVRTAFTTGYSLR